VRGPPLPTSRLRLPPHPLRSFRAWGCPPPPAIGELSAAAVLWQRPRFNDLHRTSLTHQSAADAALRARRKRPAPVLLSTHRRAERTLFASSSSLALLPGNSIPPQLNRTPRSLCTGVPVLTRRSLLLRLAGRSRFSSTLLVARSVPVYPVHSYTVAASSSMASSSMAWPLVPTSAQPDCWLGVYQCTRTQLHTHRILLPGLATRVCFSSTCMVD